MPYNQTVVNSETTAVIGDDRQQGKIRVYKVDKEDNEKKLAGAVFNVVASEDIIVHGVKLYDKGAVIETITTGEDGSADTSSLYTGFKYNLDEVKAPDGYILSGSKEISLDYDNQIEYVEAQTSVENAPTEVTITKTDFSTGELIPNCGIEILDESKNVLVQGRTGWIRAKSHLRDCQWVITTTESLMLQRVITLTQHRMRSQSARTAL